MLFNQLFRFVSAALLPASVLLMGGGSLGFSQFGVGVTLVVGAAPVCASAVLVMARASVNEAATIIS
jgi:hypothetical protein